MCWLINHLRFTKPPMARKLIIVKTLQAHVKYLLLTDFHNLNLRKYLMKNNITSALEILPEVANDKKVPLLKDNMLYQGDKQHASITHDYNLSLMIFFCCFSSKKFLASSHAHWSDLATFFQSMVYPGQGYYIGTHISGFQEHVQCASCAGQISGIPNIIHLTVLSLGFTTSNCTCFVRMRWMQWIHPNAGGINLIEMNCNSYTHFKDNITFERFKGGTPVQFS